MKSSKSARSVLIVDDEVPILELLTEILSPEGYDIVTAQDGGAALGLIKSRPFDLVITDFRMPVLSGRELYDGALAHDRGMAGRFVFITGEMDPVTKTEFIRETGVRVINKPFRAEVVLEIVTEALARLDS